MAVAPTAAEPRPVTVAVDCPNCGSGVAEQELEAADPLSGERFRLRRCTSCSLVFVSPRPADGELAGYYTDAYFGRRHRVFNSAFMDMRVRALPPAKAGARVLDIGCGRGDFLLACRRKGWQVAGVEQDAAPIMEMRRSLDFEVMPLSMLDDLPDASFDAITMWHVLEHLPDPRRALAQARRLLRPGGSLVVEVPNFASWQARMSPTHWFHLDPPRHLLQFERGTLGAMIEAEGLAPRRWSTFSAEYDGFGMLQSLLNLLCPTQAYLFQILIGRRWPGTRRDVVVTAVAALPLAVVSVLVSLVAPWFGRGGVLRVLATRPTGVADS